MESVLIATKLQTLVEVEGGSYHAWASSDYPILAEAKIGGGILNLKPFGFALPHYADCAKVGYVTQGSGKVGMISPGAVEAAEEKVLRLKKGDLIPVQLGATSWWFNDGTTNFSVVFLGDTSKAYRPGNITYFLLAGPMSMQNGLSDGFNRISLGLSERDTTRVLRSQTAGLITTLSEQQKLPEPSRDGIQHLVYNMESASPSSSVRDAGRLVTVTSDELGVLKEVGLSGAVIKVLKNVMCTPQFSTDAAYQVNHILRGSGRVQVVGLRGEKVLDEILKQGDLFIAPKFFAISVVAGGEGMDWFCMFTMHRPAFSFLAGRASVLKAMSPLVVQAALNISPTLEERLREKMNVNDIFIRVPK
ncbi:hypothetical protein ACHQM5_006361 [Ranunculus cassubicifolius]